MPIGSEFFLEPRNALQRQYEALRAYYAGGSASAEAAVNFGYTPGSFRVLCHQFQHDEKFRERFFSAPVQSGRKRDRVRDAVIGMRKRNLSIYDIQREMEHAGTQISVNTVRVILEEEGFARLPRRLDDERLDELGPHTAAVADVRQVDWSPRAFDTRVAGLFLFAPLMAGLDLPAICRAAKLPGSKMIPAVQALRTLLAMKFIGMKRKSHVMDFIFDEGIAVFAGLNVVPKRSYLASYSTSVDRRKNVAFMKQWFTAIRETGLETGTSFDLDFHTIPAQGEDDLLEKHYLSKRSRSQKGVLVFLAQDADARVLCYSNADVYRQDSKGEILTFADYWRERTGDWPEELVFDSALTTQANMLELDDRGIRFITLRRRSKKMLEAVQATPASAWRRIKLSNVARKFSTPRVLDRKIRLPEYPREIRELVVTDLGREDPIFILTNHMRLSPATVIGRYARRMLIENGIAEHIDFFHLDALSSVVGLKVDFDLQVTLMASALYRMLATRVGRNFKRAHPRTLFRRLIDTPGRIRITDSSVEVVIPKKAYNPLLVAAGLADAPTPMPWFGDRELVITIR